MTSKCVSFLASLAILLVSGPALADDQANSAAAVSASWGLVGTLVALAPTIVLLVGLGRSVGRYETTLKHLGAEIVRLDKGSKEAQAERRNEIAMLIADNREAMARSAEATLNVIRVEIHESLEKLADRLTERMVPREMAVLQLQNLETKLKADIMAEIVSAIRTSVPPAAHQAPPSAA